MRKASYGILATLIGPTRLLVTGSSQKILCCAVKHKNKNNKNNNDNEAISYQSLLVDCQHCIIIMEDGTGYGTIHEGQVIDVRHSDRSGLLSTKALYVRPDVIRLRRALDTSSCIVQGAPGVGKSIAVWSWLLAKVKKLPANRKVLWCHFRQVGAPTNQPTLSSVSMPKAWILNLRLSSVKT